VMQCFSNSPPPRGTPKIIVRIPRNPCLWKQKIVKRWLLAHGDYSSIANCRTKIVAIFRGICTICCGISK
jgi:hypothetical protein